MKKIAIFTDNLHVGGIQKSIVNILNNIDYKKYEVDLYLFDKDNFYEVNRNIKIIYLKKPHFICKFLPFSIVNKIIKLDVCNKEYDISIDFDSYQMYTAIGALRCKSNIKTIWIHNDIVVKLKEEPKYKMLYFFFKNKYKYFDFFCAVSNGALSSFKKMHNYMDKDYRIIPNYIDTKEIKEKMMEECDLNVDKDKVNIVTVGRLCHQKGIDIMLNNISKVLKTREDFHLYIIGDGPLYSLLMKQVIQLHLEKHVTFLGNKKNPYCYMKKMDLFYLQSRYEGQGMVILEAKSIGLDILIPKYLEKYCPNTTGVDDPVKFLKKYKKSGKKIFDYLKEYNDDVMNRWSELLNYEKNN